MPFRGGSRMLKVGDIVQGSLWPEVVEIKKCEHFYDFYHVEAIGKESRTYYQLMLLPEQFAKIEVLNEQSNRIQVEPRDIQNYLLYHELEIERKFSKSRAIGNQHIIPLPHQIEAVYGKMLKVPQVRFLLADDPGAGKTIMAGMLIRELKARKSVERILILVPPLVLHQWQEELKEKFDEDFFILTRASLKSTQVSNPFVEHRQIITSLYWAARDDIKSFVMEAEFDLIIVDEAHKMAAYTTGQKKKKTKRTKIYQLGESILRNSPHCLLLTATPHKGDVENFRHLMRLIDPDIFSSVSVKETLRDRANPFIIRRLKESLKQFDGSPLFPKRTTKTIQYKLSNEELMLYEAVTDYVRKHFNRALNQGNNRTAFAMMILQRRLSSSLEAIHCSLTRRLKRLESVLSQVHEEKMVEVNDQNVSEWDELTLEEQEQLEQVAESFIDEVDPFELSIEIEELKKLVAYSDNLRQHHVERKFVELENALFGVNGLLHQGEKILIFTESTDTLLYLERKLQEKGQEVAKIMGKYSIEERRKQVEKFRQDCSIMLATDAGGESINLQFCNQMINYDIPWNPNKLEQRMGRIHRIGQKNEVFIFNLVARNTREGDVLNTLLQKLERMRQDLGLDLVYDFIGERLDDKGVDLPNLMQNAILGRERLEEIKEEINQALSREYKELLKLMEEERLGMDYLDIAGMKREQYDMTVCKVPNRVYAQYTTNILSNHRVKISTSHDEKMYRIDRLPRSVREFAHRNRIVLQAKENSYRFTFSEDLVADNNVALINHHHPLFLLAMNLSKNMVQGKELPHFQLPLPITESLEVEGYEIGLADGINREMYREIVYFAKCHTGEVIELDSYWLFGASFENATIIESIRSEPQHLKSAIYSIMNKREEYVLMNDSQLTKKWQFLRRAFDAQYQNKIEQLQKYREEDIDNRNSALINQIKSQLIDIEERRQQRLQEVERERNINIIPPKRIAHFTIQPDSNNAYRLVAKDFEDIVRNYEKQNGRNLIKTYPTLSLVDFISEDDCGEERYIILVQNPSTQLSSSHLIDLQELKGSIYLYYLEGRSVSRLIKL